MREQRLQRLIDDGIIHPNWQMTDRDPTQPPFTEAENREWTLRCMEVYAAQIDRMDQGIYRRTTSPNSRPPTSSTIR